MGNKKLITYQLLCIALMVVLLVLVLRMPDPETQTNNEPISTQEVMLAEIHNRKSVRSFVPQKPVSKEDLTTIVKAGMAAPSAVNKQPWAFIVVTERSVMDSLKVGLPSAQMLGEAGAAIIVCGDLSKALESHPDYWIQDCSAATQNMLLAIESLGLGAVWTGVYPVSERVDFVKKTMKLPENIIPLNVIPIGYPAGETQPKDKWKDENVRWNKW